MPERNGYPAGVPCWVDTSQPDPEAAAAFYSALFGWELEDQMPPGSPGHYLVARIRGLDVAAVGSQPEAAPPTPVWNTYVWVDSADDVASKVRDAGGSIVMEPFDAMDAGRMAVFSDPEGAVFCVWQAKRHKGARLVNEAGTINFNTLTTRDLEGAEAFYGAVFGWETLPIYAGGLAWRLPGYGDHLERDAPGTRKRMAELGAPAGFEDVVAAISPITDEEGDVRAHWSVTFAVDDADAIAARAAELGGRVAVAPFDVPWVRTTVIADPQGATFIASQFVPENGKLGAQGDSAVTAA